MNNFSAFSSKLPSMRAIKKYQKKWLNTKRAKEKNDMMKLILGIGVLAVAGTAAGLIITAKIGKKGRKKIKDIAVKTVDAVNEAVQDEADMVKTAADKAATNADAVIEEASKKTEMVKKDVDNGILKVKNDIKKTALTITNDLKKPVD